MFASQSSPEEMMVPRNLKLLTISMDEPSIRSGTTDNFSFRKSMIISFALDVFRSRLLFPDQDTKRSTCRRYEDSTEFLISPSTVVSSADLRARQKNGGDAVVGREGIRNG